MPAAVLNGVVDEFRALTVPGMTTPTAQPDQPNYSRRARARVPIGPLAHAVDRHGGLPTLLRAAARPGEDNPVRLTWRLRRAWSRGQASGLLTPEAADLLCVRLLHLVPWLIYENWAELDGPRPRPAPTGVTPADPRPDLSERTHQPSKGVGRAPTPLLPLGDSCDTNRDTCPTGRRLWSRRWST